MAKIKRVNGRTYKKCPGAPALWCADGSSKRYSSMELEELRKRSKKKK
jgi:hypothetical protein